MLMNPRYPDIEICLSSHNPFAWVSAIRQAMRQSGIEDAEIRAFTADALDRTDPGEIRQVCASWAEIKSC